jgi:hypothetical protein
MPSWCSLGLAALVGLAPRGPIVVPEAVPSQGSPWRTTNLDLQVQTELTTSVGGGLRVEVPGHVQFRLALGVLPPAYVQAINELVIALDGWNAATGEVVEAAVRNSFVVQPGLGWRPFHRLGFDVHGGYIGVSLGGDVSGAELLASISGAPVPMDAGRTLPVSSQLHGFQLGVGYRLLFLDRRLSVSLWLDYLQIAGSRTTIAERPARPAGAAAYDRLERALDAYLDELYTTYVKIPVVGVAVGWHVDWTRTTDD